MQPFTPEKGKVSEKTPGKVLFPSEYHRRGQMLTANTDLLKSLLTNPGRAMTFSVAVFLTLFFSTLTLFSAVHALLLLLTGNFAGREVEAVFIVYIRIFGSSVFALAIAMPGVIFLWVMTPEMSLEVTFKRLMLYFEAVLFFSLLGELFFCKFIIDSMMKLQPFIVIFAGVFAVVCLDRALANEPNIKMTRAAIVGILTLSYTQAFLIIDGLLPYQAQDNINSPVTILLRELFKVVFG